MSVDTVKETIPRSTPPKRLQCLIQQAGKMIEGLMRNLKNQQLVNKEDSQASSSSRKKILDNRESLLSATSKTVQEIIKDEVSQFTESSSDGISDFDYEQLESGSTLEIQNVADDVAEVIVDEILSQNQVDLESAQSTPSLKKMCGRIKKCTAKQFAQVSICHIVERLNIKYFDSPDNPAFDKVLSRQSMQSVMSDIDALLPTVVGEIQQGQNASQWIDDIYSGETLELTEELKNILINHIDRMRPKTTSGPKRISLMVLPPRAILSADILAMAWCFLGVMRWWLHTQSETLTSRVITHTLEKAVSEVPIGGASLPSADSQGSGSESKVTTSEFEEEYSEEQEDGRKSLIRIIVMKLVWRIFDKAKVFVELRSPNTIIERLVENLWIEIEDEDFEITPKMTKHLDKVRDQPARSDRTASPGLVCRSQCLVAKLSSPALPDSQVAESQGRQAGYWRGNLSPSGAWQAAGGKCYSADSAARAWARGRMRAEGRGQLSDSLMHCDAVSSDLKAQIRDQVTILTTSRIMPIWPVPNV
ncbi:unnamed protein product [Pleuronectes platessa]|uniref:Uncharacterized protein n=1 Tax=Pleuronectes platessa TaxID=8262 RepID=A0A9N7UL48_PLEPL|nr:unnamed protein product [Pleuronectes platessa]